jgi:AraC family transcriptional regulator
LAELTVVEVKPQLVLGMRKRGRYEEIAILLSRLCEFAFGNGLEMIGPPIFVCHELTPEEAQKANEAGNADVEVAIPIAPKTEGTADVKCYVLPGGKMAKTLHRGAV